MALFNGVSEIWDPFGCSGCIYVSYPLVNGVGLTIWYKLFPEKRINALGALLLSYLPPMGVFFVMSANKLAQYLGILYILLVLVLPSKRIFQRFSPNNWNKVLMVALGAQILIVGILARSPYVLPYGLVLWWWYKLTTGGGL